MVFVAIYSTVVAIMETLGLVAILTRILILLAIAAADDRSDHELGLRVQ